MQLSYPCIITARLLPGVQIGKSYVSIEYAGEDNDGRTIYRYHIDTEDGKEFTGNDLKSGCQGGDLRNGLESLMAFLGASAESYRYSMRAGADSDNSDLFPEWVAEWAYMNDSDITMTGVELEETTNCIVE